MLSSALGKPGLPQVTVVSQDGAASGPGGSGLLVFRNQSHSGSGV